MLSETDGKNPRRKAESAATAAGPTFRTLIVDDNVGSTKVLSVLFKKLGCEQVDVAHSGREGIDKCRQYKPDVAILDLQLGDITGLEVANAIRQEPDLHHTFLIALTGSDSPEHRQKTSEAGFHLHRIKPFGVEMVHEIIELMKDRHPQESQDG